MTDAIDRHGIGANNPPEASPDAIARMTKDIREGMMTLSDKEARFLVDYYYICQEDRKRATNQERALQDGEEPSLVVTWLAKQSRVLENQVKAALDIYTQSHQMGSYMRSVFGIGPVIAAGLLAHIDISKAPTVGHIWRFAGLDPTTVWGKGEKRPHNAKLKTICYHAGQSFMKFAAKENCYYGHLYRSRKEYEISRNDSGGNKDTAAKLLPKFSKATESYKHLSSGVLPPAQIDARSRRWAVKQFLSDMHAHWFKLHHGVDMAPAPYPISILKHAHYRTPPDLKENE